MRTPLYSALRRFADTDPLRLHMPGHKGRGLPGWEELARLDFTELTPTGNLYEPGGPIAAAQALWARAFGMAACQFLTGGSTQGIYAALTLACPAGGTLLADRNSHRCVYHAMALLDLTPVYLMEKTPGAVETALREHREVHTVCITSPDYYGRLYDVAGIARVCQEYGARLVVDGAHGAHLPFLGIQHFRMADLAVCSAHKTLPALGQAALLFSGGAFSGAALRRAAGLYGTSSPSYPILASLDLARAWMESGEGRARYGAACAWVERMRGRFPALRGEGLDPGRLTLLVEDGDALARRLEERNIWPEMADRGHVVCILTGADEPDRLERFERALMELKPEGGGEGVPPPPPPEIALRPRRALFAPAGELPLWECEGRVAGEQIAPYPPGVPVVAPGEVITKKHLAYLERMGYNSHGNALTRVLEMEEA